MRRSANGPKLKSPEQIEEMKEAGRLSAKALRIAGESMRPGISTFEIDERIESCIAREGGTPTFKGYGGFPGCACISPNEVVVHGIPRKGVLLHEGDIVSVDTGATKGGWVGDNAETFFVGEVDEEKRLLCEACEAAMWAGIEQAVPGNHLGDVGHAIESTAKSYGFRVVREYVGHGVGRDMHEAPQVPNYGRKGKGLLIEPGLVIAIEPMIVAGRSRVHVLDDGWGVVTDDGRPAAHFERTIAVTEDGPVVLTCE